MKKKPRIAIATMFFFAVILASACVAQSQSTNAVEILNQATNSQPSGADFQQAVTAYQQSPSEATAEKVIKLAHAMNPPPAIPEEAREHFVMATTFAEKAKDDTEKAKDDSDLKQAISGFARAIEQYKAALLAAPWWADAYKRLAIAQKAAAHYDDAIASLNLYLLTQPADARDAQDEIYKLKALKQAAEQEAKVEVQKKAEEAQKEAERQKASEPRFEGAWYAKDANGHWSTFWIGSRDYGLILPKFIIRRDSSGQLTITRPNEPAPPPGFLNDDDRNVRYDNIRVDGRILNFRYICDTVYNNGTRSTGDNVITYICRLSEDNNQLTSIEIHCYNNGRELPGSINPFTLFRKDD